MRKQEIILIVVIVIAVVVALYLLQAWNRRYRKVDDRTAGDIFTGGIVVEELPQHHITTEPMEEAPEDQFRAFNPSITKITDEHSASPVLLYSYRVSNYVACSSNSGKATRDPNLIIGNKVKSFTMLANDSQQVVYIDAPEFAHPKCVTGFEDPRIIMTPNGQHLFIISNSRPNSSCLSEMHLTKIPIQDLSKAFTSEVRPKLLPVQENQIVRLHDPKSPVPTHNEKNWMPFFDHNDLMFVYSVNPHVILKCDTTTGACVKVAETENANVNSKLRGSSQARFYKDRYIAIAHWRTSSASYLSQGYTFEAHHPYKITAISPTFVIKIEGRKAQSLIQFVSGFEIQDDMAYITYGEEDCDSKLLKVSMKDLLASMTPV